MDGCKWFKYRSLACFPFRCGNTSVILDHLLHPYRSTCSRNASSSSRVHVPLFIARALASRLRYRSKACLLEGDDESNAATAELPAIGVVEGFCIDPLNAAALRCCRLLAPKASFNDDGEEVPRVKIVGR